MRFSLLAPALFLCTAALPLQAQADKPYSEGNVLVVTYIRVKPGMFNAYMKYLDGPYKANMEAMKKAGVIVDYGVLSSMARNPEDWNIGLTVTYANMAAFDGLTDRSDAIASKALGMTQEQRDKASAEREAMREVLGSRMSRQLILK